MKASPKTCQSILSAKRNVFVTRRSCELKTRPKSKSSAEYRAEARARDPELASAFAYFTGELGLSEGEADLLSGTVDAVEFYRAAVESSGAARAVR